jgi:predicted DNA-binding protein
MLHTAVRIDMKTFEELNILKKRLNCPKAWIVKRLVAEEMQRTEKLEVIAK